MRTLLLLLLLPTSGAAQSVALTMERINFGPVVTREVEQFVRFGSDSGFETMYGVEVSDGRWYAALRLAPTSLHVWSTADSVIGEAHPHLTGKSADPRRSRWHYRVLGRAADEFVWSEFVAGADFGWVRAGVGLVQLSMTDHGWWGGKLGPKPMAEVSVRASWGPVGLGCRGSLVVVDKWVVLESAARELDGSSTWRVLRPVACGAALGFSTGPDE